MDRGDNRIGVLAASLHLRLEVDVGVYVLARPERLLEAEDIRSHSVTAGAGLVELVGKRRSLDKRTVRDGDGEGGPVHLFPEIESRAVPVLRHVGQIVLHDRPDVLLHHTGVSVVNQTVPVRDHRRRTQWRTVALWSAPFICESGLVDVVFRFS